VKPQEQLTHESLHRLNLPTLNKRPQPILVSEGQSSYGGNHDFSQKMLHQINSRSSLHNSNTKSRVSNSLIPRGGMILLPAQKPSPARGKGAMLSVRTQAD
jgi:hypothetical protein